jgi:hypothetical protein
VEPPRASRQGASKFAPRARSDAHEIQGCSEQVENEEPLARGCLEIVLAQEESVVAVRLSGAPRRVSFRDATRSPDE